MIRYYAQIADVLLPYAAGRPVTRKRWVDGVHGGWFFQRDLGASAPSWVPRRIVHHKDRDIAYPVLDHDTGPATLIWCAQLAALELHVPQWRFTPSGSPGAPDRIVFDLDPGDGAGLRECAETAGLIRTVLVGMGLNPVPVTSGGNGIHVYAALDGRRSSTQITDVGHELARSLEADHPDLIVSNLSKAKRRGKVLIDWSQNTSAKTTITPYSLRGRARPTVAMPRLWEEITSPDLRQIELSEVFELLRHRGDAARALHTPRAPALDAYQSKRDPAHTPEPMPPLHSEEHLDPDGRSFVIHRHAARRLHYDLRLEHRGVLASWALPKGVPALGEANHLAVQVEDHPLAYATFHGDIPAGQYGAGHVDIWDHGRYDLEKWSDDEIVVTLHGQSGGGLGGGAARLALIRMRQGAGGNWLVHRMAPAG